LHGERLQDSRHQPRNTDDDSSTNTQLKHGTAADTVSANDAETQLKTPMTTTEYTHGVLYTAALPAGCETCWMVGRHQNQQSCQAGPAAQQLLLHYSARLPLLAQLPSVAEGLAAEVLLALLLWRCC
jgi:hypothetical protein